MKLKLRDHLVLLGVMASLAACSVLDFGRAGREAREAEDKAGRIALAIGDQPLEADPEMVDVPVILPVATPIVEWPQAGARPNKVVGHTTAAANFEIEWRVKAADGTDRSNALSSPPVASATTIFLIDGEQTVRAFDVETGRRLWSADLKSGSRRDRRSFGGGIAVAGDQLVASSGFGFITLLDGETGDEIWRRDLGSPVSGAPTIKDDRILVVTQNNEVFALTLATGDIEWSDQAIAESARVLGAPSVAAIEDLVVAPFSSGEVIAYLSSNGRRLWSDALTRSGRFTPISALNDIAARPVLRAGLVYAASQSGVLAAIDGRSGQRVWSQPIGSVQAPALVGEYLFVSGVEGQVACLASNNGAVIWAEQLPRFKNEGKRRGRISYAGPMLASDRVVIASSEGELIGLSPQTGEEIDRINLRDPVFIEPIAVGDRMIILTDEGRLISVR
ncbi:MAG: PQQ-binding-like beta-propeller repeat protein [Pseudomonadota bacterium]